MLYTIHGAVFTKGWVQTLLAWGLTFPSSVLAALLISCLGYFESMFSCFLCHVCIHMYVSVNKMRGGDHSLFESVSNGKNEHC